MKQVHNYLFISSILLLVFVLFTMLVLRFDVAPIGPENSTIGLATLNQFVFEIVGKNPVWYDVTGLLGNVSLLVALSFSLLGFRQFVQRKSFVKVDGDLILLALLYLTVIVVYLFFEIKIVNYRPVILDKGLEASFPSTHTMIVLSIMGSAMIQFKRRIKNQGVLTAVQIISIAMIVLTIGGRLVAGVHWFTDIVAGVLLGGLLITFYYSGVKWADHVQLGEAKMEDYNLE